jgi:hypothetical protein
MQDKLEPGLYKFMSIRGLGFVMFNPIFNDISVISCRSILLLLIQIPYDHDHEGPFDANKNSFTYLLVWGSVVIVWLIDWLIDWCLTSNEKFFSYIQDDDRMVVGFTTTCAISVYHH